MHQEKKTYFYVDVHVIFDMDVGGDDDDYDDEKKALLSCDIIDG